MWRFGLCLLLGMQLTACGFKSLHQTVDTNQVLAVEVLPIPERIGQLMQQQLQEDFHSDASQPTDFTLSVELEEQIRYLAILDDATASYGRLELLGYYTLKDKNGKVVLDDFARSESGYTIVDSEYASLKAEQDARLKALHSLADKIHQRILIGLQ